MAHNCGYSELPIPFPILSYFILLYSCIYVYFVIYFNCTVLVFVLIVVSLSGYTTDPYLRRAGEGACRGH